MRENILSRYILGYERIPALRQFWMGMRAEFPLLVGVFPFGMIYGVLAVESGIARAPAQAMSSIVFAGSAQFIATQLVAHGVPALIIVLTIFVVNLRHLLYSASVAPYLKHLPGRWKWVLAYLLTDEAFAVTILHYESQESVEHKHWFFLGAGLALWSIWQFSTAAGIFLGAEVPASWSLDFALALTFLALLIPAVRDRAGLAAALSAGVVAVAAYNMPYKLGLIAAALVGIATGLLVERLR